MRNPEMRRQTRIEFLRYEHARIDSENMRVTRGALGRLGARINRTAAGRELQRILHKEELQRRAIRRLEAQRRTV